MYGYDFAKPRNLQEILPAQTLFIFFEKMGKGDEAVDHKIDMRTMQLVTIYFIEFIN